LWTDTAGHPHRRREEDDDRSEHSPTEEQALGLGDRDRSSWREEGIGGGGKLGEESTHRERRVG